MDQKNKEQGGRKNDQQTRPEHESTREVRDAGSLDKREGQLEHGETGGNFRSGEPVKNENSSHREDSESGRQE